MKPSARKFPGAGFVIFVRNVYLYPAKIKKNMTKLSVNINKIATPCIRVPTSGTSATRMSAT